MVLVSQVLAGSAAGAGGASQVPSLDDVLTSLANRALQGRRGFDIGLVEKFLFARRAQLGALRVELEGRQAETGAQMLLRILDRSSDRIAQAKIPSALEGPIAADLIEVDKGVLDNLARTVYGQISSAAPAFATIVQRAGDRFRPLLASGATVDDDALGQAAMGLWQDFGQTAPSLMGLPERGRAVTDNLGKLGTLLMNREKAHGKPQSQRLQEAIAAGDGSQIALEAALLYVRIHTSVVAEITRVDADGGEATKIFLRKLISLSKPALDFEPALRDHI